MSPFFQELLMMLPAPPERMFHKKHAAPMRQSLKSLAKWLAIAGVGALSQDELTAAASGALAGTMAYQKGPFWQRMVLGAIPAIAGRTLASALGKPPQNVHYNEPYYG